MDTGKKKKVMQAMLVGLKRLLKIAFFCVALVLFVLVTINTYMILGTRKYILTPEQAGKKAEQEKFDFILVLGAGVRPGGEPSPMLKERIDRGVELYHLLQDTDLLMSGDSATRYHQETVIMADKAAEAGVPEERILQDRYGISTYESMRRLKEVYHGKKVLIVTQNYHLSRSVYIARAYGLEAYGVDAQLVRYRGQFYRDVREVAARVKDFFKVIWVNMRS